MSGRAPGQQQKWWDLGERKKEIVKVRHNWGLSIDWKGHESTARESTARRQEAVTTVCPKRQSIRDSKCWRWTCKQQRTGRKRQMRNSNSDNLPSQSQPHPYLCRLQKPLKETRRAQAGLEGEAHSKNHETRDFPTLQRTRTCTCTSGKLIQVNI